MLTNNSIRIEIDIPSIPHLVIVNIITINISLFKKKKQVYLLIGQKQNIFLLNEGDDYERTLQSLWIKKNILDKK